jgi:Sigma-70 region 2
LSERAGEDHDPVEALLRGEPNAAGLLVDRHGVRIYRVAHRFLDDPRNAEGVTQDVLVTVIREIRSFKGEVAFSSWIYRRPPVALEIQRSCRIVSLAEALLQTDEVSETQGGSDE